MAYKVLVLKGDGIGPEVVGEALQALRVVAREGAVALEFKEAPIGGHAIDAFGSSLPDNTLKLAKDCDAILMGGSTDNEFSKLGWRREHKDLNKLGHYSFADVTGSLVDQLGVRDRAAGVALRATFIVDPDNVIQHVSVNNLNVGRSPEEVLRILDGLQTDELCPCNWKQGEETLKAA